MPIAVPVGVAIAPGARTQGGMGPEYVYEQLSGCGGQTSHDQSLQGTSGLTAATTATGRTGERHQAGLPYRPHTS